MSTTQKISTPVIKSIKINISKRFMFARAINSTVRNHSSHVHLNVIKKSTPEIIQKRDYAHQQGWNFHSQSAKNNYSNDNCKNHAHGVKVVCETEPNCDTKVCVTLCGPLKKFVITGHGTHHVPLNKKATHLGNTDFDKKNKPQMWCSSTTRPEIDATDLKNLTEDDMSQTKKVTEYLNSTTDILNKTK